MATPVAAHNSVTVNMQKTLGGVGDSFLRQITVIRLFVCRQICIGNGPLGTNRDALSVKCLTSLGLLHFMSVCSVFRRGLHHA